MAEKSDDDYDKLPVILPVIQDGFYEENKAANIFITNEEFQAAFDGGRGDYIVLDAREDLEYNNGNYPGSLHIRYADLQAGRWIEIPSNKFIYVLCWSGIRGKEVAEFLRTKKIVASYLYSGAQGWYEYGGLWSGSIKFSEKYSEERFRLIFSTKDVKKKMDEGVYIVDCREPAKYQSGHIPGSASLPIMYTPTAELEGVFAKVPAGSRVITVCDNYVNCFDAKITGAELEARGHQFLGRYNRPWEF